MDRQSIQKLRLDRRLAERTGWIPREELDRELSALPDVSDKLTTLGEAEEQAGSARAASAGVARSEPQAPEGGAQRAPERGTLAEGEQSREGLASAVGPASAEGAVGQPGEPETSV
jgi:uncharacterized protein YidB (DUF937 family)